MLQVLFYYVHFGGVVFFVAFFFFFTAYLTWKFSEYVAGRFVWPGLLEVNPPPFRALFLFYGLFLLAFFVSGLLIEQAAQSATPERIAQMNAFYMSLDLRFFQVYPAFWMQSGSNPWRWVFDALSPFIVGAYASLVGLLGGLFLVLIVTNSKLFYEAFVAFFLTILLGFPFWYFFPAVSPLDAYVREIVPVTASPEVQMAVDSFRPNPELAQFLSEVGQVDQSVPEAPRFYPVTTMPSMHAAWGTLLLFFSLSLSPWLAIIFVPYFLLNTLGTVFTVQHYAVDVPAGIVVALVAIYVARLVAHRKVPRFVQEVSDFTREDARRIQRLVAGFWSGK